MDNWLLFWKLLLIAAFTMFGVLAIAVAIGGFLDIRALFKSVDAQHEAEHASGRSEMKQNE
jgi:hypothetical protein